jgi:hypothetical protein
MEMEEVCIIDLQENIESARIMAGALCGHYGNDGNYDKCVFFSNDQGSAENHE